MLTSVPNDPFQRLFNDIQKFRDDLKRRQANFAPTTEELGNIVSGTIFPLMLETVTTMVQFRDGVTGAIGELGDRMNQMQNDSVLLPDDADKLMAFIDGTLALCEYLGNASLPAEVKARVDALVQLGAECKDLVEAAELVDDDEEDDDETEDEDGQAAQA